MRIAIEATWTQGNATGIGVYVRELLRAFARLGGGHTFLLLHATRQWSGPDFGPNFVPVSYWAGKKSLAMALRLNRVLRRHSADLYHATFTTDVPPRISVPCLVTVHDLFPLTHPGCRLVPGLLFRHMIRWAVRNAGLFLANSRFTAAEVVRVLGVDPARVIAIPLAATPPPQAAADEPKSLLCLGAVEHRKGQLFLLDVYEGLAESHPELPELVFAGPSRGDARADRRLESASMRGKVRWLRYVSEEEKERLFAQALLLLAPSTYEGFGLPPLEAMARGVPVLCSDIPALREVGGEAACYAPAEDAASWVGRILELLADRERRGAMAEAGRRRASTFSWDLTARRTFECYERLLTRS
jgi:glycosyltransferase involved in cell wall biosynthesis